ncbi:MAG: hypothetical protein D3909_04055 [Candidatus Electrothrix sp. ATG1]|nr:hypothetical protein [Candidatus Electrothrix sp. ATG1]
MQVFSCCFADWYPVLILCCFLFGGVLYFSLENCMDRDFLVRISVMLPNGVQEVPEKKYRKERA